MSCNICRIFLYHILASEDRLYCPQESGPQFGLAPWATKREWLYLDISSLGFPNLCSSLSWGDSYSANFCFRSLLFKNKVSSLSTFTSYHFWSPPPLRSVWLDLGEDVSLRRETTGTSCSASSLPPALVFLLFLSPVLLLFLLLLFFFLIGMAIEILVML